jgi:adhesin transport system outer membrane protein
VQQAEAALDTANAQFYPSLNAFWEYWRKENDQGQKDTVQLEQRFGVEYSYNLLNGGGDMQAVKAATHDRDAGVSSLKDMARTVRERIQTAWQNLLTARSRAEWFLELARKERTLGNRSLLDVLAAETDFYNAQIQLVGAEYDQMIEAYNLLYAMGRLELDLFL